ncbi:hypothetical protein CC80DRAFT_583975 [Byssothecium circinans]|uniref:Uncharacterized protein n=1 Tax=Byssothecium circinans TaxID=147558 RepID=A0A6A5U306_9PLEO|nr:hypothetical protein CC80DRAFT_583975 [Byssothecium circinans]
MIFKIPTLSYVVVLLLLLSQCRDAHPRYAPPVNATHKLSDRAVPDETWKHFQQTGCNLLGNMVVKDEIAARGVHYEETPNTAASPFTDYGAFREWGYTEDEEASEIYEEGDGPELEDEMEAMGLDSTPAYEGGPNYALGVKHTKATTHNSILYPATGAAFRTIVNADEGVIIAWWKFGPKYMGAQKNPPVTTLPKLKNWHDIAFLQYQKVAQERKMPLANLRYIFSATISNKDSIALMSRAVKATLPEDCEKLEWDDRKEFKPGSESYDVLIASPNGRGAALMLITHKAVFGQRKVIGSVTVFCSLDVGVLTPTLLFEVKQEEKSDDDGEDHEEPGKNEI